MLDEYYVTLCRSEINKAVENLLRAQSYLVRSSTDLQDTAHEIDNFRTIINRCNKISERLSYRMIVGEVKKIP